MKPKDTSWSEVAPWYDELLSDPQSYQRQVILPNLLRLLGETRGKRILDLACGQGFFSKALVERGAVVTGVDLSGALIARAQKEVAAGRFFVASVERLPKEIQSGTFDVVICILALQNIRGLNAAVREASRSLKRSGRFLIVLNHPCFRIPRRSSWAFDETLDVQYRRLDGYLSESSTSILMHPGSSQSPETVSFHRPLQLYMKTFGKHGFLVERLEEWISHKESEKGRRSYAETLARKEFPLFLYLGLVKG